MAFTVEIMILLEEGEKPTKAWWLKRYSRAARRAGTMPAEIPGPEAATLRRETDPDNGDRYVRVTLPLAEETGFARARELCHMLSSVMISEGYTLRENGQRTDEIAGEDALELTAEVGDMGYDTARVCSGRCLSCAMASETKVACCGEGAAFSLADIGSVLVAGDDKLAAEFLALPGEIDGVKWQTYLVNGKCTYHSSDRGCTLPSNRMPLQCRTYLCMPEKLLPPQVLAEYEGYVDALEEAERFIEEHMRDESGVEFNSPLGELKEAAKKAFAAWSAGSGSKP